MDTLESAVAEDARPDAGLGRVDGHNIYRKPDPLDQSSHEDTDLEAGPGESGMVERPCTFQIKSAYR